MLVLGTTKYDEGTINCEVNKGTKECDDSTIICDLDTIKYDDSTINVIFDNLLQQVTHLEMQYTCEYHKMTH